MVPATDNMAAAYRPPEELQIMTPETLRALATEIANQSIANNWVYYVLLAALTALLSAAGAFLSSYASKRAERLALTADFDEIKRQLQESTSMTESIKTDIQRLSDRSEKLQWLKREKLEAYVIAVLSVTDYFHAEVTHKYFDSEAPSGNDPWTQASMLQELYLPELDAAHNLLRISLVEAKKWMHEGMEHVLVSMKAGAKKSPGDDHMGKFSEVINALGMKVLAIENEVKKLSREMNQV